MSGDLPVLSGEDTAKCTVLEAAGDGNCSLHSIYRLLHPERDSVGGATPEEIRETRQEMVDEMPAVAFSEDYGQLLVNTVSEEEMLRLSSLNFDKGFYRKCTSSSGRATRRKPMMTVREVVEDIHKKLGYGETTGCFVGNLFGKDFLHLVYNDCGGYGADSFAEGAVTVRNPSSSNVAETKLNHFSAIVIPQELVPWALPYMLARGSSGESGIGHRKAADDYCPCATTSDKRSTKHRGSPIALDTDDDDETETNSSVRSPRSAGGAPSVTTAPTGVSKPETPPGKAAIKPATLPSASSMGENGGDNETEYVQDPEGDEDMSDGGSDGEFPGGLANYDEPSVTIKSPQQINAMVDKIPEGWGKPALRFVFELVQHTHDFRNGRKKKNMTKSKVHKDAPEGCGEDEKGEEELDTADEHVWTTRGMQDADRTAGYDGGRCSGIRMPVVEMAVETATAVGAAPSGIGVRQRVPQITTAVVPYVEGGGAAGSYGGDGFDFDGEGSYRGDGHGYYDCHRNKAGEGHDLKLKPSKTTLDALPMFDPEKLGRFSADGLDELAFTFFCIMFPAALISHLVLKG
ncbi:unnamed protein product [Ectocarpus sp. CCAP 1310/34]|nr:unnamed protein product [Ectocarpus sp. CCAP 1310/34]